MAGIPPASRRRRKKKTKSGNAPKSNTRRQGKTKGGAKRKIRISGVILLTGLLGAAGAAGMYLWASSRVDDFLVSRRSGQHGIVSASTEIYSTSEEQGVKFSDVTWRKMLSAHGYTESSVLAPKTYAFKPGSGELAVMQADRNLYVVALDGQIKTLNSSGTLTASPMLSLEPVPLGNAQSNAERVGLSVPLAAFSKYIVDAIVAVEDERFFSHFGIDLIGIARAVVVNAAARGWVQGGSTLTQQLAKNIFLSANRSLTRKFKEVFLSIALERSLSKEQLLEIYLNEVYMGSQAGSPIRGIPAAARWLFNKSPGALTLSESALLAGMIQAPAFNNPRVHPDNAEERRRVALQRLLSSEKISAEQFRAALADVPRIYSPSRDSAVVNPTSGLAPFAVSSAQSEVTPSMSGILRSSISPPLQRCAEQAVSNGALQVTRRIKRKDARTPAQIGLVAINVQSSQIVALVGGTNFAVNTINHVTDLPRQFGSTVKPFVYLRAFENGTSLSSHLEDEPFSSGNWNPENFDHRYRGIVTARYALENSLNLPTIRLARNVGLETIARTFLQFGLVKAPLAPYPAMAIGALEGTLADLTNAYAALARGGRYARASILVNNSGPDLNYQSVADERAVFLVTNALQGVVQRGTARGFDTANFPSIAGKTGTSDSARDAWFVGYTPSHAVGVWVGFDDNKPLGLTGGAAAAPIAANFLRCSSEMIPKLKFTIPAGVTLREIDEGSDVQEFFIENEKAPTDPDITNQNSNQTKNPNKRSWVERLFGL